MNLISPELYLFLFSVLVIYYISPLFYRKWILIASSGIFFLSLDFRLYLALIAMTFLSYSSIAIQSQKAKYSKVSIVVVLMFGFALIFGAQLLKLPHALAYSFFTISCFGAVLDVFHKKTQSYVKFENLLAMVSFFPIAISGPIERLKNFGGQLESPSRRVQWSDLYEGGFLISLGVLKKLVLSPLLGALVLPDHPKINGLVGVQLWLYGLLAFAAVYIDFSAYINLARGIGRIFGFKIVENFKLPYWSKDPVDVWRRWNISLVNIVREHFYSYAVLKLRSIHLGIFLSFWLIGFWHEVSWKTFIWGTYWAIIYSAYIFLRKSRLRFVFNQVTMLAFLSLSTFCFLKDPLRELPLVIRNLFTPVFSLVSLFKAWQISSFEVSILLMVAMIVITQEVKKERAPLKPFELVVLTAMNLFIAFALGQSSSSFLYYVTP